MEIYQGDYEHTFYLLDFCSTSISAEVASAVSEKSDFPLAADGNFCILGSHTDCLQVTAVKNASKHV